jgi:MFS family permease
MKPLDLILTLIGPILTAWLAVLLLRRKLHSEFPFFFCYLIASVLLPLIQLAFHHDYLVWFKVVWSTEATYVVLALFALHEVFRKVFAAFYEKRWFWLFFPVVVIAISVLAVIYRLGSPPAQANQVMSFIISLGMAVNLVQALLFVLFFVLVWFNGIGWREYPFGIVMGFAAIAIGGFIADWARSEFGTKSIPLFSYAPAVAYILAVVVWLNTFLHPPGPEPQWRLKITPELLLDEMRQYSKILEKLRGKGR